MAENDRSDVPFLLGMLHPNPDAEMAAHPISTAVNSPAFDESGCITSIEDENA